MLSKTSILRSLVSGHLLLLLLLAVVACTSVPKSSDSLDVTLASEENFELSDEELGSMIKDFGQKIGEAMKDEVAKLIDDVEDNKKGNLNEAELERFKEANEAVIEDTQARIEMAGKKNNGEMTRSIVGDKAQSFLTQVSGRLQSAGSYLGQQMGSLARMAPKIKGQMRTIPGKLRKLMQWPTFLRYKIRFNKVYKSLREELYRQLIYLQTQTKVGVQNLKYLMGKTTHLLKSTQFADITDKEYRIIYNNPQAESEVDELTTEKLDPAALQRMKTLKLENRNIFGQDMEELDKKHQESRRRKRSLEYEDNSELDDDEEMEDAFEPVHATAAGGESESEPMDTDEFKVVDDYAAEFDPDADLDAIDEVDDVLDNALDSDKTNFKPIDLRDTKCIPQPENQDKCGACYAYVTTAAASYYNCIQIPEEERMKPNFKIQRLNSRFLSDCGRYVTREGEPLLVKGCSGGKLTKAFNFTGVAGAYPFMQYELDRVSYKQFKTDNCAYPRPESIHDWAPVPVPFFKNTRIVYLVDYEQIDLHLRTVGPVFVNIRTWNNFRNTGIGIYDKEEESTDPVIHSMWIVGHDKDTHGRDYWILWNSHGIAWGEHGFVRIYSSSLDFYKVFAGGVMNVDAMKATG